jgi:hypothetical protein
MDKAGRGLAIFGSRLGRTALLWGRWGEEASGIQS